MTEKPPWEKSGPLPGERDFDPDAGDLDAQVAWKHFGGLTLSEAYQRFQEDPEKHTEDFMYMGGKAFAYYFPVLERYLLISYVKESIKVHVASGHPYISNPEIQQHVIAEWDALEQHLQQLKEQ